VCVLCHASAFRKPAGRADGVPNRYAVGWHVNEARFNGSSTHTMPFIEIPWKSRPVQIDYQWVGPDAADRPVVVFLHEGLGCIAMWRDFPERFCREHGLRGLVFSRYGYGNSTPRPAGEEVPVRYLHDQALEALPAFLSALGVERPWLFGHSDGASIALLYAHHFPGRVAGLIAMAPHIFVEDITFAGIERARIAWQGTDMKARLGRYHADPESVFRGWNDTWLAPAFRQWNIEDELAGIRCPVLLVQGEGDEYGTLGQLDGIRRKVPHAEVLALEDCGHSPQRDQPDLLSKCAGRFIRERS